MLLACCSPPVAPPIPNPTTMPEAIQDTVLVLGDISDDPGEVIEGTQPLADYLAAQLSEYGITRGEVRIAATTNEMAALLESGEVDLYFDSAFPATSISDASGALPILRRARFGVDMYTTVIFTTKESGITSIDQLKGQIIAFDNQFSTSGFLLPAVILVENQLILIGKSSYNDPVEENEVGFVFSSDDVNTLQWVLRGLAAVGATNDYHFDLAFPPEAREQLVELARTEPVPRQVVLARPRMDPVLLEAIKTALISVDDSEAGIAALIPFQTTQFDEFPDGIEAAADRMREMIALVEDLPLP